MDTKKTTSALPADGSSITPDERPPSRVVVEYFESDIDAAPLHLNAVRTPVRLQGKHSSQNTLLKVASSRSRSSSRSRPTSCDTSPCPSDIGGMITLSRVSSTASSIAGDLDSSITSGGVEISIDRDILLDRMGMGTSPTINDSNNSLSGSIKILPCLNERMSDETLDDCHAFTDLRNVIRQIPGAGFGSGGSDPARSRDGSVSGGSILGDASCLLETLEEFEEESDGGDDINVSGSCEDDDISALGLSIKHRMSLDTANLNESGVTCNQIEVDHTEEFNEKD